MKKLVIGIVNNKEIADWFGCSQSYFSKMKKEKLE